MKKILFLALLFGSIFQLNGQCEPVQDNVLLLDNWDNDNLYPGNDPESHFSEVWGYVHDGREYGIIGGRDSIFIIDVTDPRDIFRVQGIYQGDTSLWRDMKIYDEYLYSIVDGGFSTSKGVVVYDLGGLPGSVTKVNMLNDEFGRCHNIYIDEDNARLYAVGMPASAGDICIYSLSDPANPSLLACHDLDTISPGSSDGLYIHDIFVRNNIAYCGHGYSGYYIWDVSDANDPVELGSLDNSFFDAGYVHSSWNSDDNDFAIVATEVGPDPKLYLVNQTNPALMSVEVEYKMPLCDVSGSLNNKRPHNPYIIGNKIFCSYYHDGLQVLEFNTSTPDISRVGYYDTYPDNIDYSLGFPGNWGAYPYLPSGTILASDRKHGLFTLKYEVFTEYVFEGPGTDWYTASNWKNGVVPPSGFEGKVIIESNCIKPSTPISDFDHNELIIIRGSAVFTQE